MQFSANLDSKWSIHARKKFEDQIEIFLKNHYYNLQRIIK
jgi:hypothetical protein